MYGSGLIVMNGTGSTDRELKGQLEELLPWLHDTLKEEEVPGGHTLERW
jgi:23S rRNA A2030 N6-methylase RlmJ